MRSPVIGLLKYAPRLGRDNIIDYLFNDAVTHYGVSQDPSTNFLILGFGYIPFVLIRVAD